MFECIRPNKPDIDVRQFHDMIGELALANYFLEYVRAC